MSNEELDRKIEFIVEQQAQFAADIQVMREVHEADTKLLKEQGRNLSDAVTTIVGLVGGLAQGQQAMAEAQETTAAQIAELVNAQSRTDERLNVIIGVVERYFGGNGGTPSQGRG